MFEQYLTSNYGAQAKRWLKGLPKRIEKLAELWQLSHLNPLVDLSYHYVLSGFQANKPIILKLGMDISALENEANALRAFKNHAVVSLLAKTEGALLLERAVPGSTLKDYWPKREEESIVIVCRLIKTLSTILPSGQQKFPHIRDWLATLDKDWDIPRTYLEKSRKQRDHLLGTSEELFLLHADLHHGNVLKNGEDWLLIDPKGVFGELTYEVAAFIRNPMPELIESANLVNLITTRILTFASLLNLDRERIRQWCFVQAVLAWCWSLEDGFDPAYFKHLTEVFDSLSFDFS